MPRYKMLDDGFLTRFKNFMAAERRSPEGAFDSALPKAVARKDPNMKYRFVPVPHCGGSLFLRERSANLAFDEATEITPSAKDILEFLRTKISDEDLHQVEEYLRMEAGVPTESDKKADAMIAGAKERRGAQDSAAALSSFNKLFPSAQRIGIV